MHAENPMTVTVRTIDCRHGITLAPVPALALALVLALPAAAQPVADTTGETALGGGETGWRWIGIRPRGAETCPRPRPETGWTTEPLFAESENRALRRFCLYHRAEAADPAPLRALALERLDPDVMGLAPQGSTLAEATWRALETHFLSQAGQVALPAGPATAVRLAVVDTAPTGAAPAAGGAAGPEDMPASSPHGTALLHMARDLLCDAAETACRAQVAARLALAYECFDPAAPRACRNAEKGGYVGLIGELAQALQREVTVWQGLGADTRLVLNLSLGWHADLGGDESTIADMPASAQAVYRALEDAVCRGALPIVAAGNRGAEARPSAGPFLPALWERRAAPTRSGCRRLGVTPAPGLAGPARYRPLVFSVAAVEATGAPLDTTRVDGVSRLAAFGDHAAVARAKDAPTGTLTGSSVAALVVSATAAAVWSYRPGADAFTVMAALYRHGTPLDRQADYCLGTGPCPARLSPVRQIALCPVLAGVCAGGGCDEPVCDEAAPLDLSEVDFGAFETAKQVDLETFGAELAPQAACGGAVIRYDGDAATPADPCPHRQYDGPELRPWTEPQPEDYPCPNCGGDWTSPGTVYLEIDDLWRGTLRSATLVCGDELYALGLGPLRAGDRVRLTAVPETCATAFPTFFAFTQGPDRAVISPLHVCVGCTAADDGER